MGTNGGFTARSSWTKETQDERDAGKRPLRERQKPSLCKHTTADFRIAVFCMRNLSVFYMLVGPIFLYVRRRQTASGIVLQIRGNKRKYRELAVAKKPRPPPRWGGGRGGCVNEMIFGGFAAWHIAVYVGFLQIKTCILLKTYILRGDSPPTAYTLNLFK